MKLRFLPAAFLFFCTFFTLHGQSNWAPTGAHWYFCQGTGLGSPNCGGYFYQEVAGDTLILGQPCRRLTQYQKDWQNQVTPLPDLFTFERNDSVYFFQPDSNRFLLTYDFRAQVGDTLSFPTPFAPDWEPDDTAFVVVVDSIVGRPAGQDTLRFFYVHSPGDENWGFFGGWYAEKIGGRNRITPFPTITIPEIDGDIRCYADDSAYIKFSLEACDFTATGWLGQNAEWTYGYYGFAVTGYEKMRMAGDTVIQGWPCKKIQRRVIGASISLPPWLKDTFDLPVRYVFDAYDKVYTWQAGKGFVCLYDFNLGPGDTLSFPAELCMAPTRQYVIDSVGVTQIEGVDLRYQKARMLAQDPFPEQEMTIIERLGEVYNTLDGSEGTWGYFFLDEKYSCFIESTGYGFRCYHDDDIGLFKIGSLPCDFITATNEPEPFLLEVFPNPAGTRLTIRLADHSTGQRFVLYNLLGETMLAGDLPDAENTVHTSALAGGVYWLSVWTREGGVTRKIIKE